MKLKSKTLLIDEDEKIKIRPCYHNYARMTTFEYLYYKVFIWKSVQRNFIEACQDIIEPIKEVSWFVFNIVTITLLPISLYVNAKKEIKKAKNEVWENKCYNCEYRKSSPIIKSRVEDVVGIDKCIKCELIDGMPTEFVELIIKGEN